MSSPDSQQFESFVPVYDMVPENWEDAREFLVEHLKKISNAVNIREIGWLLDEELLNGQQLFSTQNSGTSEQYRSVLRKVIDFGVLNVGLNSKPHGITVNARFSLLHMYAGATDAVAFTSKPIPNAIDDMSMDATNVYITVAAAYTRCFATIEYVQEL